MDRLDQTRAQLDAEDAAFEERFELPPLDSYAGEPQARMNGHAREDHAGDTGAPPSFEIPKRKTIDWSSLADRAPPSRDWAVRDWLPMGHAALLAGRGGIGKTLLAQIIGTALVTGKDYAEKIIKPRRVLIWAGEDEEDEMWRRQIPIAQHFGIGLAELADKLIVQSYLGADITLAGMAYGALTSTLMMTELREQIGDYKADYVFLDSSARIFGGNENDRHQVTLFISMLNAACAPTGAGVCVLAHPGKSEESEYSGSTAWEGSVRSRVYLTDRLPDDQHDDDDDGHRDDRVRFLMRRKANYSAKDYRRLQYMDGMLVPDSASAAPAAPYGQFAKDQVLRAVRKLADLQMYGNASTRSPDYLPKLAKDYNVLGGLTKAGFGKLMRELITDKALRSEIVGQYSNRTPKPGLICDGVKVPGHNGPGAQP